MTVRALQQRMRFEPQTMRAWLETFIRMPVAYFLHRMGDQGTERRDGGCLRWYCKSDIDVYRGIQRGIRPIDTTYKPRHILPCSRLSWLFDARESIKTNIIRSSPTT